MMTISKQNDTGMVTGRAFRETAVNLCDAESDSPDETHDEGCNLTYEQPTFADHIAA